MKQNLKISVIGLGSMGSSIYNRLKKKGFSVFGYDNNLELTKSKKEINYKNIDYILEVSDVILFAVPSNKEISNIIENKILKFNSTYIDLTTSNPQNTIELYKYLKLKNISYFDAAMSGGASGALNGTLTLMIGGKKEELKYLTKIFSSMASNVFYYGNIGNGHSMKLLHNSVCHGIFLMMCEIGNLGEELGISLEDLINTFNCSNARSYISQERFPNHILNKKFDGKSIIKNLKKDLQLVKDFSDSKETSNNYIKLTSSLLNDFNNKLDLNDFTEIYKLWNKNIVK
jgi:3-hydroxyisobutyrate dehydrogenase